VFELLRLESGSAFLLTKKVYRELQASIENAEVAAHLSKHFNRFEILKEIGRGVMSYVFKAVRRDQDIEQVVALKLLKSAVIDEKTSARFFSECSILAGLSHPNICRFIDSGVSGQMRFIATELIDW
jgi:serine/threonine protein kinase